MMNQDKQGIIKKPIYKRWWFWLIVVVLFGAVVNSLTDDTSEDQEEIIDNETEENTEEETEDINLTEDTEETDGDEGDTVETEDEADVNEGPVVEDAVEEATAQRDNSAAVLTTLNTGTFLVGTDIPEGRYKITGDGSGNLIIYDKDDLPYINEILGGGDIGVNSVTTDISNEDSIEISGINHVTFTPAETVLHTDTLTTGSWLVGMDIAPGRYDIKSSGGSGNLFVFDESGWPEVNEILGGDYGVEKVTANLEDGFTIEISGINEIKLEAR